MDEPQKHGKPHRMAHFELLSAKDLDLSEEDIESDLLGVRSSTLFLKRFTLKRIYKVLREENILAGLERAGFHSPVVSFNNTVANEHRLTITDHFLPEDMVLCEIHLKVARFRPSRSFVPDVKLGDQDFLYIEWLSMQNPLAEFTEARPRLPGQKYPGLGLGHEVVNVLIRIARILDLDGIINCPEYYHNAVIYQEVFKYYDPHFQGRVLAMKRDLAMKPLHQVSDAVDNGYLTDAITSEPIEWTTQEQILPLSGRTMRYFGADAYRDQVLNVFTTSRFAINWDEYLKHHGHE